MKQANKQFIQLFKMHSTNSKGRKKTTPVHSLFKLINTNIRGVKERNVARLKYVDHLGGGLEMVHQLSPTL